MLWLAALSFLASMDLRQNSMPRGKGFLSSFYIAFWPGHFITAQRAERAPACSITGRRRMSSVALFEDIWGRFLSYSKTPPSLDTEVPKMPHSVKYLEDVNEVFLCEVECYVLIIQFSLSVSYIKVLSHSCFKLGLRSFLLYPHYRFRLKTKTRPWEVRGGLYYHIMTLEVGSECFTAILLRGCWVISQKRDLDYFQKAQMSRTHPQSAAFDKWQNLRYRD